MDFRDVRQGYARIAIKIFQWCRQHNQYFENQQLVYGLVNDTFEWWPYVAIQLGLIAKCVPYLWFLCISLVRLAHLNHEAGDIIRTDSCCIYILRYTIHHVNNFDPSDTFNNDHNHNSCVDCWRFQFLYNIFYRLSEWFNICWEHLILNILPI